MEKIKILVIDDDRIILKTMSNILEEEGYEAEVAATGEEGIRKARDYTYDLIFLDLNIPDKPGIEILKEIRMAGPDAAISIITGYGTVDSAIAAMKLNAYDYILKPLDPDQVLQSVKMVLKRKELEKEILKNIPKPKVLLVNISDDTVNRIREKLEVEKIQVLTSHNPREAIEYLRRDSSINTVICDLGKKDIDGLEFLETLKGISLDMIFIPITSLPSISESVQLMKEGARDYLVKPVQAEDIYHSLMKAWGTDSLSFLNRQLIIRLQKLVEEVDMAYDYYKKIMGPDT